MFSRFNTLNKLSGWYGLVYLDLLYSRLLGIVIALLLLLGLGYDYYLITENGKLILTVDYLVVFNFALLLWWIGYNVAIFNHDLKVKEKNYDIRLTWKFKLVAILNTIVLLLLSITNALNFIQVFDQYLGNMIGLMF